MYLLHRPYLCEARGCEVCIDNDSDELLDLYISDFVA